MDKVTENTSFIGTWNGTEEDLVKPFLSGGDMVRAKRLAKMYLKYCPMFKDDKGKYIRPDIAFAQMCHETGYLTFKGIAKPDWNNFAGIGITGVGAVQKFASEDLGVVAHIAHLAWYFFPNHVHTMCSKKYDPRHFGDTHYNYNGDTSIKRLNGAWAVPGTTYASSIAKIANVINENVSLPEVDSPIVEIPVDNETYELKKGDKGLDVLMLQRYLISQGFDLKADGIFGPITESKVKEYQKIKGLPETGIVTEEVKKAMNDFVVVEPVDDYQVIIQRGHVGRISGATGTFREIEFNTKLGNAMDKLLAKTGLKYRIMDADNWLPNEPNKADIFLALHGDGSTNKSAKGYSLGFKPDTNEEFKEQLAISYGKLSGFPRRKDNYTANMRKYYAWRDDLKTRGPHIVGDNLVLIEHGFLTNDAERNWLFDNIDKIAKHHVDLIVGFLENEK